ncbi:MAG: prepilin-type N-terminal cleavage/methylation domain-containing protein [Desulfobacteraceae bacterium]|nr:prepilin-type N-terminal cleavage/methylation domain-containing protein [Desulfobacteraceae bacterium]
MKNKNTAYGFTLIEMMVAITIFLIVMTNAYTIFDTQQRSYLVQREIASMQQNLRLSMYVLSKDLKMANCYLGSQGTMYYNDAIHDDYDCWGYIRGITSWNNYKSEGSDIIDIAYANFFVQTRLEQDMPKQSSVLKVSQDSIPDNSGSCPLINSEGHTQDCFEEDDLVVISDGIKSNLLQITKVSSGDPHLGHSPDAAHPFNCPAQKNWEHDGYLVNSRVFEINYISYRISRNDPDHPSLSYCSKVTPDTDPDKGRTYQPVAENIEDLQLKYILEDGTETDDFDGEGNEAGADFSKVRSVRISMVARSDRPFPHYKGKRPALEDNPGEKEDHFIRRVYTAEIEVRNINIIK